VQRGPAFPKTTDVGFDRDTGRYRAKIGDEDGDTCRRKEPSRLSWLSAPRVWLPLTLR
jgi:hypothetical protein